MIVTSGTPWSRVAAAVELLAQDEEEGRRRQEDKAQLLRVLLPLRMHLETLAVVVEGEGRERREGEARAEEVPTLLRMRAAPLHQTRLQLLERLLL